MELSRIYEVNADKSGTAYAITDQLLLTAQHVVAGANAIEVWPLLGPNPPTPVTNGCHEGDVAVLSAKAPDRLGEFKPVAWGTWKRRTTLPCQICGFPRSACNQVTGVIDSWAGAGEISPGDAARSGLLAINLRPPYPATFQGMSGTAVFAHGFLIGVITDEAADWVGGRLYAEPIEPILRRMEELGLLTKQELVDFDVKPESGTGVLNLPARYRSLPATRAKRQKRAHDELRALLPDLRIVVTAPAPPQEDVRRPHGPRRSRRKRR